jgi:fibronectin type 3 domain-containing protein
MNITRHLRRGLLVAATVASVVGGLAGTTRADNATATTAPRFSASTANPAAAHTPTPDGAVTAVTAPSAPRAPTARARNTAVRLTWARPSSNGGATINTYRVQRATSKSGPWKRIAKPTVRRYRATGLKNGKRYYFRIAAHNPAGWSTPSKVVSAVPRTVPKAPLSPVATPGKGMVALSWSKPSSNGGAKIDKYRLQRSVAGGSWKTIAWPTTLSHTAGGLTNGKSYSFRVGAHNAAGWSRPSTVVSAVPRTVPTAPLSPVATPGKDMVALSWSKPTSNGGATIDAYRVQKATNGGPWEHVADLAMLGYDANGLSTADTYAFRIRAHNKAGWSAPSTVVQSVPYGVPRMPLNPFASVSNDQLTITWSAPTYDGGKPIVKYYIYASASVNGPYTHVGTADPPSLKYVVNLSPVDLGNTYYYRIVAENAFGVGPHIQITVQIPAKVPSAPPACGAVQLGGSGSDTARIIWTPPFSDGGDPILFYRLKIWDENGPLVLDTSVWSGTTYDASPLPPVYPWERYDVKIAAYNKVGPGPVCAVSVDMWNT